MKYRSSIMAMMAVGFWATLPDDVAEAALHPYYDRAAQIETLLDSHHLSQALDMKPIERLTRLGEGPTGKIGWSVESDTCAITVTLDPIVGAAPGPTRYKVIDVGTCD